MLATEPSRSPCPTHSRPSALSLRQYSISSTFHISVASRSTDITYHNVSAATWSAAELNVGIICACLPATRPIINLFFPRLLSTARRDNTSRLYSQRGTYVRNESIIELSKVVKPQSEASKDDTVSFDQENEPNAIRVKTEWTITEKQRD